MNKYGQAAIRAVELLSTKELASPKDAWEVSTIEIFGDTSESQSKVCPKNTFLGLCESGKVKGVIAGKYTKSKKNKEYAIKAVELLKNNMVYPNNSYTLWKEIMNGENKLHNSQMDVVLALWEHGFII